VRGNCEPRVNSNLWGHSRVNAIYIPGQPAYNTIRKGCYATQCIVSYLCVVSSLSNRVGETTRNCPVVYRCTPPRNRSRFPYTPISTYISGSTSSTSCSSRTSSGARFVCACGAHVCKYQIGRRYNSNEQNHMYNVCGPAESGSPEVHPKRAPRRRVNPNST